MKLVEVENISKTEIGNSLAENIANKFGKGILKFISEQVDLLKYNATILTSDNSGIFECNSSDQIRTIIDLEPINSQKDINSYFRTVNKTLPDAGIYIGCVESKTERKARIKSKFPSYLASIIWVYDFIIHRVIPKIGLTKRMYSFFTGGRYHVLSKAEVLGRLSFTGFEIIGHKRINNLFYFSVIKTSEPQSITDPSYGIIFKMNRVSIHGKIIGVYKVRTMHAYSEYLQDYVVKMNGYNEVGKPNHDFRLTSWGRIIRKLHLDEIPQLLNVLRGELNIVGVRPLSKFGFSSLPKDLQQERIKYKPGCIPPNVSLGISGFYQVIRAERIYLRQRKNKGYVTDFIYLWLAIGNLLRRKNFSA